MSKQRRGVPNTSKRAVSSILVLALAMSLALVGPAYAVDEDILSQDAGQSIEENSPNEVDGASESDQSNDSGLEDGGSEGESEERVYLTTDYESFLSQLKVLEAYANDYASANSGEDATNLVLNYIRTGLEKYCSGEWETLAGPEKTAFVNYVAAQDELNGTTASNLRAISILTTPNGQESDITHLFASMDITYYASKNDAATARQAADLSGWAGDLVDLLDRAKDVTGSDIEEMTATVRSEYLGVRFERLAGFDYQDIRGDLDSVNIMTAYKNGEGSLCSIVEAYYSESLTDADRAAAFLDGRFGGVRSRARIRESVKTAYDGNILIQALVSKQGLDSYVDQATACNYAFAEYLYELVGDENGDPDEPDNPDNPDNPDEPDTPTAGNEYYTVFSSTQSELAPGIVQNISYARTADKKQIAYYTATVDVTRDDVSVYANYNNNDASSWGLQSVTKQMAAAKAKHSNPSDASNYIENYNTIVGVNGDFFNMQTGEPSGALVMNGTTYHGVGSGNFFGITKDGKAVIGTGSEWAQYADQMQEAIGASILLVRDGKSVIGPNVNYYKNRASRTCVGITADGKVVLMVLDGRQEPFSAGGSSQEIAQIMIDAGCVTAVNLDGGGSSTFAAKQEGADEVTVVNRPSDAYERNVSSSLLVVSTAAISNEFDHAALNPESVYLSVGASTAVEAVGVSESGGSATIPEGASWVVADESLGSISDDGVFTATAIGEETVNLISGDEVIGTTTIHIVEPDGLEFDEGEITAVYGSSIPIPIKATYQGNAVTLASDSSLVLFMLDKNEAGSIEGTVFTAADENCGARSTGITAYLRGNSSVSATSTIYLYKSGEAVFDFNSATDGDRKLAWKRDVSNSNFDGESVYTVDDPTLPMEVTYVFALDMNDLSIPENIEAALPIVAAFMGGGSSDGLKAWDLLLGLAERISPTTTVTVSLDVDPDLDVDYSNVVVNCEYFEPTNIVFDEESNKLVLTCNWIKVDGPIDPGTANPLCIVSGLKFTPKANAAWDANNRLSIDSTGTISYMARLRSSQAYSIAGSNFGQQYGLKPYDNSANLDNDKGAEFSSKHADFEDAFILDNTDKEGWITEEDGSKFYYINNKKLTSIQEVPDPENTGTYYYQFGDNGVSQGKYTGLLTDDNGIRLVGDGQLQTGWQSLEQDTYYFDKKTGYAVDGSQTIDGGTYGFSDHKLVKGALVKKNGKTYYYWAGKPTHAGLIEYDGDYYYIKSSGEAATGSYFTYNTNGLMPVGTYQYDNDGKMIIGGTDEPDDPTVDPDVKNGLIEEGGELYYYVNGVKTHAGLIHIDTDGDGEADAYYYIKSNCTAVRGRDYFFGASDAHGLMPAGTYTFAADGKMVVPGTDEPDDPTVDPDVKNGLIEEGGELYYYVNGVKTHAGLIHIDTDGDGEADAYYYIKSNCTAVRGRDYFFGASDAHGLMPAGTYTFAADGKMVI